MYFEQIRLSDMGCASYLIGSEKTRQAAVVDPGWHVDEYLKLAHARGLKITHIFETHLHADHVSGNRRLAQLTGATIYLHKLAKAAYPHIPVEGGSVIKLGEVSLKVLSTPGHTWESIALLIEDTLNPTVAPKLLSGDTLFIGDVGRPDFAGQEGAGTLFDSLQREILPLPDTTEVYPAHLSGSLCGRSMSKAFSSVLGTEKTTNPALQYTERAAFVDFLTSDLPPTPPDFRRIVELNRTGAPSKQTPLTECRADFTARLGEGTQLVDVREPDLFWQGHLSGALNVPLSLGQFGATVAFFTPVETPIVLIVSSAAEATQAQAALGVVGRYKLAGFACYDKVNHQPAEPEQDNDRRITPLELSAQLLSTEVPPVILDVREPTEFKVDGLSAAQNIPLRQLKLRLAELEGFKDVPLIVVCASGYRSSVATSYLLNQGWSKVRNLKGGMNDLKVLTPAG